MLKKIIKSLLSISICSLLFTGMIFAANPATSEIQTYNEYTFYVQAKIYNKYEESYALTSYSGTGVQIYAKNTSTYGNNVTNSTTAIDYNGGDLKALYGVSSGYAIKQCIAYGNIKTTTGTTLVDTVTAVK